MTALALSPGGKARVLIAADHLATRTGLRLALGEAADCSEADDAATAIATAIRDRPDVCVVDFDPPGRAIRAVAEITSKVPGSSVVVMTRRIDEEEETGQASHDSSRHPGHPRVDRAGTIAGNAEHLPTANAVKSEQ